MMAFGLKSAACAAERNAGRYTDDWFGFSVDAPQDWNRGTLQRYSVPGAIRAAWAGPRESSIVVFAQEPGQAVTAKLLLDPSIQGMKQADHEVREQEVREIAGKEAMWLVVSGKGTFRSDDTSPRIMRYLVTRADGEVPAD